VNRITRQVFKRFSWNCVRLWITDMGTTREIREYFYSKWPHGSHFGFSLQYV